MLHMQMSYWDQQNHKTKIFFSTLFNLNKAILSGKRNKSTIWLKGNYHEGRNTEMIAKPCIKCI